MSSSRFWFVPLKDVVPEEQGTELAARDEVRASDLPTSYAVPSKLHQDGIRAGHVLALHDGENVTALARLLALDASTLHWRRLPMLEAPELSATPGLREITPAEAQQFKIGIDAILRDVPASTVATAAPSAHARTYTPTGPASNIILYGPPGTGKTHSVRRRALELIGDANAKTAPLMEVNAHWRELRRDGQIVFCTFHQAFAYEEFVEGLRAITDGRGNVHYRVEPGTFKELALTAAAEGLGVAETITDPGFDTRWSLLVAALETEPRVVKSKSGGDYILETSARDNIRACSGGLNDDSVFVKDPNATPLIASRTTMMAVWEARAELGDDPTTTQLKSYNTGGSQVWMVYRQLREIAVDAPNDAVKPMEKARRALAAGLPFEFDRSARQYVLVIDEINRANIGRVFGELITLLEPDKRLGNPNELRVQLPASKEWFGVPPNIHVLGTMNTADRSIALMDVALRRRFTFEEMMPDKGALKRQLEDQIADDGVRKLVLAVFDKLNERVRFLYDREHQIGHAYFFEVKDLDGLRQVFATKIIPLLQEYFFGRWDKIALALGHPHQKGAPIERGEDAATILTVRKMVVDKVLGFPHDDHDDYRIDWGVHPAFRPREKLFEGWSDETMEKLFREVAEDKVL